MDGDLYLSTFWNISKLVKHITECNNFIYIIFQSPLALLLWILRLMVWILLIHYIISDFHNSLKPVLWNKNGQSQSATL